MSGRVNRRGALRQLLEETARNAETIGRQVIPVLAEKEAPRPEVGKPPARARRVHAGRPSRAGASLDELLSWAEAGGLGERLDAIENAARLSFRATPAEPGHGTGRSRIGGRPDLRPDTEWPTASGKRLDFVAQIDLPASGDDAGPHGGGRLSIFHPARDGLALSRWEISRCQAVWEEVPEGESQGAGAGRPIVLTPELTLPRVWSSEPQALGLDEEEHVRWEALRLQLAREQGVEPFDQLSGLLALHRVLGYPDERTGDMPLICELQDREIAIGSEPVRIHPRAAELQPSSSRWRLLLQLSRAPEVVILGGRHERLYIWIDERRLRARDFSRLYAIKG